MIKVSYLTVDIYMFSLHEEVSYIAVEYLFSS